MVTVLMVCLGNICRSPLAEGILKAKIDTDKIYVDSAGTGAYHVGNLPDPRSIEVAAKYGIDITDQRARAFSKRDFKAFDYIYAIDASNYNNILKLAETDQDRAKVQLILNEVNPTLNAQVPDPYYGGENGFEHVFQLLDESCEIIAKKL